MKAVVKYGFEKGETEIREVPVPEIGPDEVLIKVMASGVCGTDLALDNGEQRWLLNPPVILGHEFSGIISKVGANMKDWKVGQRVVSDNTGSFCGHCASCNRGDYLRCDDRRGLGFGLDGGFTSYVRIPGDVLRRNPDTLFLLPDNMSFEEAAIMDPCSNAYRAVVQDAQIKPGDDVVIFGVGPLALFAIQIAKLQGANRIICVGMSSDAMRFEIAKKFGAYACIETDKTDVIEEIKKITDEIYIAIDCTGKNAVLKTCFNLVRSGGKIVLVGMDAESPDFSLSPIVRCGFTIVGHQGYDWECWHNSLKLYEQGKLDFNSMITAKMSILQFREAFTMASQQKAIKIILYPEGE